MEVLISLIISLGVSCAFGVASMKISENKGYDTGFAWGFWLGIIGIIVVLCKKDNDRHYHEYSYSDAAVTSRLESIADGTYSPAKQLPAGSWRCASCGKTNPSYTGTCSCGGVKPLPALARPVAPAAPSVSQKPAVSEKAPATDEELLRLQKLKQYKELLDCGAITQEEYDKKKAELLK